MRRVGGVLASRVEDQRHRGRLTDRAPRWRFPGVEREGFETRVWLPRSQGNLVESLRGSHRSHESQRNRVDDHTTKRAETSTGIGTGDGDQVDTHNVPGCGLPKSRSLDQTREDEMRYLCTRFVVGWKGTCACNTSCEVSASATDQGQSVGGRQVEGQTPFSYSTCCHLASSGRD